MDSIKLDREFLWDEARETASHFNSHYGASPEQQRPMFDEVLKLGEGDWVVELGVCNGYTAAVLCSAANAVGANYLGVDKFVLENNAATVRKLFSDTGLEGTIMDEDTHDVGRRWGSPLAFLFIDAGHDEANVKPDIELWVKWVKPGGVVAFHDWDEPYDTNSPHWAIRFYGEQATAGWERIDCPTGMAMFRRPL